MLHNAGIFVTKDDGEKLEYDTDMMEKLTFDRSFLER